MGQRRCQSVILHVTSLYCSEQPQMYCINHWEYSHFACKAGRWKIYCWFVLLQVERGNWLSMLCDLMEDRATLSPRSGGICHRLSDEVTHHLTPCFRSFTVLFCARYEFINCMGDFGTRLRHFKWPGCWTNQCNLSFVPQFGWVCVQRFKYETIVCFTIRFALILVFAAVLVSHGEAW